MFLKVISKTSKALNVYQCDRFLLKPNDESNTEDVTMESNNGSLTLMLGRKEGIVLYVMNDAGQTIDTFYI